MSNDEQKHQREQGQGQKQGHRRIERPTPPPDRFIREGTQPEEIRNK